MPKGKHDKAKPPNFQYSVEEQEIHTRLEGLEKNYRPRQLWTRGQEELLRRFYGKVPNHVLRKELHRSFQAILDKALALGLTKPNRQNEVKEK